MKPGRPWTTAKPSRTDRTALTCISTAGGEKIFARTSQARRLAIPRASHGAHAAPMSATSRVTDQTETAGPLRPPLLGTGPMATGDSRGKGTDSSLGDAGGSRYVRIEGIAAYTALTVRHLHDLTRRREIPHIRVGKVVLYDKVAVDEWLSGRQTQPAQLPDWRRPIGAAPARRRTGHGRTR